MPVVNDRTTDPVPEKNPPRPEDAPDTESVHGWAARLRAVPVGRREGDATRTPSELPEVPEEIRDAARLAPDHWLGVVDPLWNKPQEPPAWAIVGQWRSGSDGEVVEWADNPDYRPSPEALDWDPPEDPVDAATQLAATGYGPAQDVSELLARAEVAVLVDASGSPVAAAAVDGSAVVPVFSSQPHLAKMGSLRYRVAATSELVSQIPDGHGLLVNPAGPVAFLVSSDDLAQALERAARETAEEPGEGNTAHASQAARGVPESAAQDV